MLAYFHIELCHECIRVRWYLSLRTRMPPLFAHLRMLIAVMYAYLLIDREYLELFVAQAIIPS